MRVKKQGTRLDSPVRSGEYPQRNPDATGGTQNFTFSNNDNGMHIFSYTFNALGFQTITVADTTNSSILGSFTVDVLAQTGGGGGGGGP